jgi:RAQPRD family integrative conjugative element protein
MSMAKTIKIINNKLKIRKSKISELNKTVLATGLIGFMFFSVAVIPVYADTAAENTELARMVHILDSLQPIINAAEGQRDPRARVQFQYNWLRKDLTQIKDGIQQKINMPRIQPRVVKPLKGDFMSMGGNVLSLSKNINKNVGNK